MSVQCLRWWPVIALRQTSGCENFGLDRLVAAVGKIRMAAAVACHIAALTDHSKTLAPGEIGTVAVIAASRVIRPTRCSPTSSGFLMSSPLLAGQVEGITRDEIMLKGDICISVTTNSFRTARGKTLLACIGDEVAYWRDEDTASLTSKPIARCCRR